MGNCISLACVQAGQVQRLPSESASQMGELGAMSSILPDDLLIEILSERLQVNSPNLPPQMTALFSILCG